MKHKYFCCYCGSITTADKPNLNNVYCINCNELTEYKSDKLGNLKKLQQARIEALSNPTKQWKHVFQCCCSKTKIQHDYDKAIPCECGGTMKIKYSYDNHNIEYNAITGEPEEKKISVENPLKVARKKAKLSQTDVAKMFKVKQQFISQMENNERPIPKNIYNWINSI